MDTLIGKIVTRQAWEIECAEDSVRFLKNGQDFKIHTQGAAAPLAPLTPPANASADG